MSDLSSKPVVQFKNVDIVFGSDPKVALPMIDAGHDRSEIQSATQQVLGVAGCTLDVHQGEIVVLMGLSGSGKSTLLRAVNGLNPVIRGETLVAMDDDLTTYANPESCSAADLRQLRQKRVAMVFQQFGLLPWRTVRENVVFGLEISGMPKKDADQKVDEQLEMVGLSDWADRQVHELSGGMQQRVGLARAFATDAPVLLMDEPFSALDPLIRDKLQDDLLELQSRLKRTIIFVSHDLDEALKLGNRIAIMEGGRIIQFGTAQEIILNPATAYVEEFVAHMNPLSVLRAAEVMQSVDLVKKPKTVFMGNLWKKGAHFLATESTPIKDVMAAQMESGKSVFVEREGIIVGEITINDVIKALVN